MPAAVRNGGRKRERDANDRVVQERHANLERVGHGHLVGVAEELVREIVRRLQEHHAVGRSPVRSRTRIMPHRCGARIAERLATLAARKAAEPPRTHPDNRAGPRAS